MAVVLCSGGRVIPHLHRLQKAIVEFEEHILLVDAGKSPMHVLELLAPCCPQRSGYPVSEHALGVLRKKKGKIDMPTAVKPAREGDDINALFGDLPCSDVATPKSCVRRFEWRSSATQPEKVCEGRVAQGKLLISKYQGFCGLSRHDFSLLGNELKVAGGIDQKSSCLELPVKLEYASLSQPGFECLIRT